MTDINSQPQRTKRGLDMATAAELADLFHELSHNKETRGLVAKAIKKVKADSPHAEAFKDVEIEERFESLKEDQEKRQIVEEQRKLREQQIAARQRLLDGDDAGRKYSEDDLKKIEDLMNKKGMWNYEDGATLYAATLPPVDPQPGHDIPPAHGATWEFPEWATFGKDPIKASRDTAHQVIGEFMRKRR